jgi:hypothetical protein
VGDIFRLTAQALPHATTDQEPNAARSGICRERRRPQGGLLQKCWIFGGLARRLLQLRSDCSVGHVLRDAGRA